MTRAAFTWIRGLKDRLGAPPVPLERYHIFRAPNMWAYLKDAVTTHPFNFFTLVIALAAAGLSGWASLEAHLARRDASDASARANEIAQRNAVAAEQSNMLVKRTQEPLVLPRLNTKEGGSQLVLANVKESPALNVYANYKVELSTYELSGYDQTRGIKFFTREIAGLIPQPAALVIPSGKEIVFVDKLLLSRPDDGRFTDDDFSLTRPMIVGILRYEDDQHAVYRVPFCLTISLQTSIEHTCVMMNELQYERKN